MPRNVSDIYFIPPGTEGFPDTTIESEKYNNYIHDVETDLNTPRPISAGGTGANDADEALGNLGAEKASQEVTNYDSHVFYPGSFFSAVAATGAPVAGHKFVGIAVSSDLPGTPPANQNVVIRAYDQNGITVPGRIYVREKKAGVWGPWSIDGTGVIGPTPPVDPPDGLLWWDNITGQLYVWYRDVDTSQWVIASPSPDPAQFLLKAGDTMAGFLTLSGDPTNALHAASKAYVDALASGVVKHRLFTASGTYTPDLKLVSAIAEVVGGGGGGGSVAGAVGTTFLGGGGGGGGYCRTYLSAANIGASQAVTVGAGGTAVFGGAGNPGGTSSLGVLCIAFGGGGGAYASSPSLPFGGAAGDVGSGSFGFRGGAGKTGMYYQGTNLACSAGDGGDSWFGRGGVAPVAWGGNYYAGIAGSGYGGGGSGGGVHNAVAGAIAGGGTSGVVIVTEFCRQ